MKNVFRRCFSATLFLFLLATTAMAMDGESPKDAGDQAIKELYQNIFAHEWEACFAEQRDWPSEEFIEFWSHMIVGYANQGEEDKKDTCIQIMKNGL